MEKSHESTRIGNERRQLMELCESALVTGGVQEFRRFLRAVLAGNRPMQEHMERELNEHIQAISDVPARKDQWPDAVRTEYENLQDVHIAEEPERLEEQEARLYGAHETFRVDTDLEDLVLGDAAKRAMLFAEAQTHRSVLEAMNDWEAPVTQPPIAEGMPPAVSRENRQQPHLPMNEAI